MDQKKIDRINELARKAKAEGLTEEEQKEREVLRQEYLDAIMGNLRRELDNTYIVDEHVTPPQPIPGSLRLSYFRTTETKQSRLDAICQSKTPETTLHRATHAWIYCVFSGSKKAGSRFAYTDQNLHRQNGVFMANPWRTSRRNF